MCHDMIPTSAFSGLYDTIRQINVRSKADDGLLNLAHGTKRKKLGKKTEVAQKKRPRQ